MISDWFVVHDGLAGAARFPSLARSTRHMSVAELVTLITCGATAAAAVGLLKLGLGIPGHSIVLAALPMALGMALAPRRFAGSVMSGSAVTTAWVLTTSGAASYGSGAIVSLTLLGVLTDIALRGARPGWRIYVALLLAGVATNLLALGSRAATKLVGIDPGGRPFDSWWLQAIVTYTASGIIAGLLGAFCWFHFNDRFPPKPQA